MREVLSKGKIRLELLPWVTNTCGFQGAGRRILEEEIDEGATIGTLIRKMASEHPAFRKSIFVPNTEDLSGDISIVLNGRFLDLLDGLETPIKDGDTIILFPVIEGG